ncbi:MAG: glutamate 5-kinase [Actinomycetota bacterium]|nr:glutamate 5-kinase [Actinomycetota bacterium]
MAKIGSSSLTDGHGQISHPAIDKLATEVAGLRTQGHRVVIVTSGAIAAGLPAVGMTGTRQVDVSTLQAVSSVGQIKLMAAYDAALGRHGLVPGQVLLSKLDLMERSHAVQAQETFERLLHLGAVPVVNENDAVADDEIRYGDNDQLAALVAHLVTADLLVLLTDTSGLHSADPRLDANASLIDEIVEFDRDVERALVGGPGTVRGSGGMVSKVYAAKMAAWSGIRTVIAAAERPGVLAAAVAAEPGVGTVVWPRHRRLAARKLWIAFAQGHGGVVEVDEGAREALVERHTSLLPVGVIGARGDFRAGDAVEIADKAGTVFAKGLVRMSAADVRTYAGWRTKDLPEGVPHEVVHRDDLVFPMS